MFRFLSMVWQRHFKLPQLIQNSGHRAASPLELFIDLAYVGMLSAVVHFLIGAPHLGGVEVLGFVLRFMSMFALWYNMVWYNNLFEDSTWRHRGLMVLVVFSLLMQQVALDAQNVQQLYFLGTGFMVSRLLHAYIWWSAVKQEHVHLELRRTTRPYIIGSLLAAFTSVVNMLFFQDNILALLSLWTLTVLVEFFLPSLLFQRFLKRELANGNGQVMPPVSHHLFMERFALIFILILGEGTLAATHILANYGEHLGSTLLFGALVMFIALFMWQMYFGFVQLAGYDDQHILLWSWLNVAIFLAALTLLGVMPELYHPHHAEHLPLLRILFCIGVAGFIAGCAISNVFAKTDPTTAEKFGYDWQEAQRGRTQTFYWGLLFLVWIVLPVSVVALIGLAAFWFLVVFLRVEYARYRSIRS